MKGLEKLNGFNAKLDKLVKQRAAIAVQIRDLKKEMRKAGLSPAILEEVRGLLGLDEDARDSRRAMIELYARQLGATPIEDAIAKAQEAGDDDAAETDAAKPAKAHGKSKTAEGAGPEKRRTKRKPAAGEPRGRSKGMIPPVPEQAPVT